MFGELAPCTSIGAAKLSATTRRPRALLPQGTAGRHGERERSVRCPERTSWPGSNPGFFKLFSGSIAISLELIGRRLSIGRKSCSWQHGGTGLLRFGHGCGRVFDL